MNLISPTGEEYRIMFDLNFKSNIIYVYLILNYQSGASTVNPKPVVRQRAAAARGVVLLSESNERRASHY